MAYRIANVGKTGILNIKKSNSEQVKYRPDLGNVDLDISSELNTNTTGQFNTITGGLLESCVVNLKPIQSGSGTPSPQNVRPITGHTAVEVLNRGFNLWDEILEKGEYNQTTGQPVSDNTKARGKNPILIEPNTEYCFYCESARVSGIFWYDANDGFISYTQNASSSVFTATSPQNAKYVRIQFPTAYGTTYKNDCCVNVSDENVNGIYEPYQGQDVIVNLGQTVYGGSLNVVTGVGSDTDEKAGLYSGFNYSTIYGYFYKFVSTNYDAVTACEIFKPSTEADVVNHTEPNIIAFQSNGNLIIYAPDYGSDTTSFNNDVSAYYYTRHRKTANALSTTPTQIETLIGENNVSVPLTGQSLDSLSYREMMAWDDVEKAIEPKADKSSIAYEEKGSTATKTGGYTVGEHFLKDGKFCTAIASISSGATLTLNTNYVEGTIADAVRYEQAVINMSEGLTYTARDALRNGRVADIYINMTAPNTSSASVVIGTTPFNPQNQFAFLPVYSGATPYEIVGSVFIRKGTGEIVLSKNSSVTSGSLIYIEGSYICQRQ